MTPGFCAIYAYIRGMQITAKFSSTCPECGQRIREGSMVEWNRGAKAMHVACVSGGRSTGQAKSTASPRKPRAPKVRRQLQTGEQEICNKTGYDIGATIHAVKIQGGGGPDGCYWTVMHTFFVRANEDMGNYSDLYYAYVRAATDAECAPMVVSARSKERNATCVSWLTSQLAHDADCVTSESDTGRLPSAAETVAKVVIGRKIGASGAVTDGGTTYALTTSTVVAHHSGYYDDYRSSTRTVARTDELAQVITALAAGDLAEIEVCADRIEARGK